MENYLPYFNSLFELPSSIFKKLNELYEIKKYKPKKIVLKEGERINYHYYIHRGYVRYFIWKDKKKFTLWLVTEGKIIYISPGYIATDNFSAINIETIGPCEIYRIKVTDYQNLCTKHPQLVHFCSALAKQYSITLDAYIFAMRSEPPEGRLAFVAKMLAGFPIAAYPYAIISFSDISRSSFYTYRGKYL